MKHFIILLLTVNLYCFGQTPLPTEWVKTAVPPIDEQGEAWSVTTDYAGSVYWAVNQTTVDLFKDLTVYKLDESGNEIWSTPGVYRSTQTEQAYIIKEQNGIVYTGGRICDCADLNLTCCDLLLVAFNGATGDTIWSKRYDVHGEYEECDGMIVSGDSLFITGWTREANQTWFDVLLMKTDLSGNVYWQNSWDEGLSKDERQDGHIVIDDSCMYFSGISQGVPNSFTPLSGLDGQATLWKFDRAGNYMDHTTWGYDDFWIDYDDALGMTSDGTDLIAVGMTSPAGNNTNWFIRKYTKDLQLIWQDEWGGTGGEAGRAVTVDENGNIWAIVNTSSYGDSTQDIGLLRYTSNGQLVGFYTYATPGDETAQDVLYYNGALYISGSTNSTPSGNEYGILLKVDTAAVAGVDEITGYDGFDVKLFPNPSTETVSITVELEQSQDIQLRIYSLRGDIICKEEKQFIMGKNEIQLDTSFYPEGTYLLSIISGGHKHLKQFIVVH